jgi:hypothetical protein
MLEQLPVRVAALFIKMSHIYLVILEKDAIFAI